MRGASWDRQGHPGFDKLTAGSGAAGRTGCFAVGLGLRPGHIFCLGPGVPARAVFREDRYNDLVLHARLAVAIDGVNIFSAVAGAHAGVVLVQAFRQTPSGAGFFIDLNAFTA